ncbi:MAG: HNH endonuclease [bacterium]
MSNTAVVLRSETKPERNYQDYREPLRYDFYFSCAYCSITEFEAGGVGFEIDHYLPQSDFPKLRAHYNNLMYSCEKCNGLKANFYPDEDLMDRGCYVIRVDQEDPADHFEQDGSLLKSKTETGTFNREIFDLNRQGLRRVRDLRLRNNKVSEKIVLGLTQLASIKVERARRDKRLLFARMKQNMVRQHMNIAETLDELLREYARSPLLDVDPDRKERMKTRKRYLEDQKAILPSRSKKQISKK